MDAHQERYYPGCGTSTFLLECSEIDPCAQVSLLKNNLQLYYDDGNVPYELQEFLNGEEGPVLDRNGWLKLQVFEARASPHNAYDVRNFPPFSLRIGSHDALAVVLGLGDPDL